MKKSAKCTCSVEKMHSHKEKYTYLIKPMQQSKFKEYKMFAFEFRAKTSNVR